MNTNPKIGERSYYVKKRYICVKATDGCGGCDLLEYSGTPAGLCDVMRCKSTERPDRTNVILRLQPKYRRKDVKGGKNE